VLLLNQLVDLDEILYEDDIEDDLDSILINPVSSTISKWWTLKLLWWVQLLNWFGLNFVWRIQSVAVIYCCVVVTLFYKHMVMTWDHFTSLKAIIHCFLLQFHTCSWYTASSCCVKPASPVCRVSLTGLLYCYTVKVLLRIQWCQPLLGRTHLLMHFKQYILFCGVL
jgi:hypothetical protein